MERKRLSDFHGIRTVAQEMHELFARIEAAAASDAAVLVRGETGAGKELVAHAIHRLSPRCEQPFRAVNCATFSPDLLASELFGHVKGAFTGAVSDRPGLFKQADGGTIFLDEIAETPLHLQAQLLRVIEEQVFVPVGAARSERVDVRVVSATHRALRREVMRARFRADLMYRVRVIPLFLPPLRARTGDVAALTEHFIETLNSKSKRNVIGVDPAAMHALVSYSWPGNVRELRNVLEYAFVMGKDREIQLEDLTPELRGEEPPLDLPTDDDQTLEERRRLLSALRDAGGNKAEAAKALGISRTTLWRKLRNGAT